MHTHDNYTTRPRCTASVTWYDLDPAPRPCVLDAHAEPLHHDGARWFDEHGLEAPALPAAPVTQASFPMRRHNAGWKERAGEQRCVDPRYRAKTDARLAS